MNWKNSAGAQAGFTDTVDSTPRANTPVPTHQRGVPYSKRGVAVLRDAGLNRGTAFTREERVALGLEGLLPDRVSTLEEQVARAHAAFLEQPDDISKHSFLRALQDRQELLYYALIETHIEEMLPIIYTPTVGDAVQRAGLYVEANRGLTFSPATIDHVENIVAGYAPDDVQLIVATDSSAILGIGDQGAGGTEIAIGKLAIYTAAGGVPPMHAMPVTLDVGTDRHELREDPLYVGAPQKRLRGEAYLDFIDRFVDAAWSQWPSALIQWEDLARDAAFEVLERTREKGPSFNDDIQGTGAVVLAGVLAHCTRRGLNLADQRFVIHGAGAGGLGVAWALRAGLERHGRSADEARARVLVIDSRGLLVEGHDLEGVKRGYAQRRADVPWAGNGRPELLETIRQAQPTVLIGLSGIAGAFDQAMVEAMLAGSEHPLIMPLSNPTSLSEADPQALWDWSGGRVTVATGSPFPPVRFEGGEFPIGQGNNAFIFPGLGHGVMIAGARQVSDGMILAAAEALARFTCEWVDDPSCIYPAISAIREAARAVTIAVVEEILREGLASWPVDDVPATVDAAFWEPRYHPIELVDPCASNPRT